MKIETCVYSGYKIHPGHGKRVVRPDGKVQIFLNNKAVRGAKLRRNPRDIRWTVLYRIKNKKGSHGQESVQKKRTKKTVQVVNRAVAGMTLEAILAKRNQTEDFRRQQREQATKAAKDANRAARAAKQSANKEKKASQPKQAQKAAKTTSVLELSLKSRSSLYCPFALTIGDHLGAEHVFVSGAASSFNQPNLITEKLSYLMSNMSVDSMKSYVSNQLRGNQIIYEFLEVEKYLVFFFLTVALAILFQLLVLSPMSSFCCVEEGKSEYDKREKIYKIDMYRGFIVERSIVILFVIVNVYSDSKREMIRNDYDRETKVPSDSVLFTLWFLMAGMILSTVANANLSFDKAVRFAKKPTELCGSVEVKSLMVLLVGSFIFSTFMFAVAILTVDLVHIAYASLLIIDGALCWIRSSFVMLRVALTMNTLKEASSLVSREDSTEAEESESERRRRREYFVNGGRFDESLLSLESTSSLAINILRAVQYAIFLFFGCGINGKLIPLVFAPRIGHHLRKSIRICKFGSSQHSLIKFHTLP
ncbi:unnamed protein product [Caenorhabditis auriculariae]|uniref:Large ribosomal subunit protein eL24 n=1 Tax=Caenorhabditis auriculariae TaxID=2777116 RepID=A0A8S1H615_9PELO|nr:unnamed protein product [Caenorhabditis auriculariae]